MIPSDSKKIDRHLFTIYTVQIILDGMCQDQLHQSKTDYIFYKTQYNILKVSNRKWKTEIVKYNRTKEFLRYYDGRA